MSTLINTLPEKAQPNLISASLTDTLSQQGFSILVADQKERPFVSWVFLGKADYMDHSFDELLDVSVIDTEEKVREALNLEDGRSTVQAIYKTGDILSGDKQLNSELIGFALLSLGSEMDVDLEMQTGGEFPFMTDNQGEVCLDENGLPQAAHYGSSEADDARNRSIIKKDLETITEWYTNGLFEVSLIDTKSGELIERIECVSNTQEGMTKAVESCISDLDGL